MERNSKPRKPLFSCCCVEVFVPHLTCKSLLNVATVCDDKSPLLRTNLRTHFIQASSILFTVISTIRSCSASVTQDHLKSFQTAVEKLPHIPHIIFATQPQPQQDVSEALSVLLSVLAVKLDLHTTALRLGWRLSSFTPPPFFYWCKTREYD